jgi:hypothetical protein
MNEPPTLIEPSGDPGEQFIRDLDVSPFLLVVISDPDSDRILCSWRVPDLPTEPDSTCNAESNNRWASTLTLDYDLQLDGEIVEAYLFDQSSGAQITVEFLIQVGGEF